MQTSDTSDRPGRSLILPAVIGVFVLVVFTLLILGLLPEGTVYFRFTRALFVVLSVLLSVLAFGATLAAEGPRR